MTEQYVGQINIFGFNFAPTGWQPCNGQILPINQYSAVFALLGTTYGGNGVQTFALPDLRSRTSIGFGPNNPIGSFAGEENHTLLVNEMPLHNHALNADAATAATSNSATPGPGAVLGRAAGVQKSPDGSFAVQIYNSSAANNTLAPQTLGASGGSLGHENRMPYLVVNFCIALTGLFPSRN
jgi:microcystin-dependent protein